MLENTLSSSMYTAEQPNYYRRFSSPIDMLFLVVYMLLLSVFFNTNSHLSPLLGEGTQHALPNSPGCMERCMLNIWLTERTDLEADFGGERE